MKRIRTNSKIHTLAITLLLLCAVSITSYGQKKVSLEKITTNVNGKGLSMKLDVKVGHEFNNPGLAIWIEDTEGNYIQDLYISESVATGVFDRAKNTSGKWESGNIRRPAALPYWSHKRNIKAADGLFTPDESTAVPDAYSGATPVSNFQLVTKLDKSAENKFRVVLEVNQSWDWNDHWTNGKYPNNSEYKTSSQPSLVYAVTVYMEDEFDTYFLNAIGHGHFAGENGNLYTDLSTLSTAKQILDKIVLQVNQKE